MKIFKKIDKFLRWCEEFGLSRGEHELKRLRNNIKRTDDRLREMERNCGPKPTCCYHCALGQRYRELIEKQERRIVFEKVLEKRLKNTC